MLNVVYDPFLTSTTTISEKNSFMTQFFTLFVLSRASDNTTSQNIGGGGCMGRLPTSNFGGTLPQFPLGLRPWGFVCIKFGRIFFNLGFYNSITFITKGLNL